MNMEFSKKASIWAAVAVLILIVGGYFGVYQGLSYIQSTAEDLSSNKQIYQAKQDRLEKLSALESKIDQAYETINLMSEALPTEDESASSVSIIDSLVARSGAKLISYVRSDDKNSQAFGDSFSSDSTNSPEVTREELEVSLVGSYPKISSFIASLGSSRRPFSVSSATLNQNGANINLVGYYLASN